MELLAVRRLVVCRVRFATATLRGIASHISLATGESQLRVLPNEACAFQRGDRHAAARQQSRTAAGDPPRRSRGLRAGLAAGHLRRRGALRREGVFSAGRDGVRGRHHAVAGRGLPRAASDSPRGSGRADRERGRRRRRLHGRPDLLAPDGMEHPAAGAGSAAEGQAARVRPAAGALAGAAEHARRSEHFGRAIPDAEIRLGRSRRSNSCRRPSPSSCCSSRPWCCSSRAGGTCAAR